MTKRMKRLIIGAAVVAALIGGHSARAEDYGQAVGVGTSLISHADITITGAASAVQICPAAVNQRISACVQNTGNTNNMRCADSNAGASQGVVVAPDPNSKNAGGSVCFSVTGPIYCYSASGTTAGCTETKR